jgi:hypothetical protein
MLYIFLPVFAEQFYPAAMSYKLIGVLFKLTSTATRYVSETCLCYTCDLSQHMAIICHLIDLFETQVLLVWSCKSEYHSEINLF